MNDNLWLSWETHTRTRSISNALNIDLVELTSNKNRLLKYLLFVFKTINILIKKKPKVLIIQNPSIVLGYLSIFLRPLFGYKLIMDCHNAALYPLEGKYLWLVKLAQFLVSRANVVVVTNNELAEKVIELRGIPLVLNDPIPIFEFDTNSQFNNIRPKVTLIATWAEDEPIMEFLSAASSISNVDFFVTGKLKDPSILLKYKAINFPGFVTRDEYIKLISSSDLIVDLTTRENCLVCGAYEAVGVNVPLLLSDTASLKATFDYGALFCENTEIGIEIGINKALSQLDILKSSIIDMKKIHMARWEQNSLKLKKELENY
jgi:transcription elongation factor Elf1